VAVDADPAPAVLDRSWTFVSGHGPEGPIAPVPGHPITLEIEGDRWAGSAGCNRYTTTVTFDGASATVSPGIATTLMACADDVIATELAYLVALQAVQNVDAGDDRLTLLGPGVELAFRSTIAAAPTSVAQPGTPLVGTEWAIVAIDDGSTGMSMGDVVGSPWLRFAKDGSIAGTTGCNRFFGRFEGTAPTLTVGPLATTRMACDAPAAAQEQALLRVLSDAAVEAVIGDDTLQLSRAAVGSVTCTARQAG
jgi:heat shock protein HslJ